MKSDLEVQIVLPWEASFLCLQVTTYNNNSTERVKGSLLQGFIYYNLKSKPVPGPKNVAHYKVLGKLHLTFTLMIKLIKSTQTFAKQIYLTGRKSVNQGTVRWAQVAISLFQRAYKIYLLIWIKLLVVLPCHPSSHVASVLPVSGNFLISNTIDTF